MSQSAARYFTKVLLLLLFLLALACSEGGESPTEPSGSNDRVLSVPLVPQQTPVWCWAAASEMIFRYYGRGATQCQILSVGYQQDCCSFPQFCQTTASIPAIQQTLFTFGGLRSTWIPGPISLAAVAAEIDSGRPIIVAYRGSFSGHVVVIYGYDSNGNVFIRDPFYGTFKVPYGASFSYNGQLFWSDTIAGIG
jgi:peptidase C39-like protein